MSLRRHRFLHAVCSSEEADRGAPLCTFAASVRNVKRALRDRSMISDLHRGCECVFPNSQSPVAAVFAGNTMRVSSQGPIVGEQK